MRFTDVLIAISGGVDSAIVSAIAVDALGSEHVVGVLMPSRYSSDHSISDAELLALAHELAAPVILTGDVVDAGAHPALAPVPQVPAGGVTTAPVAIPSLQLTA